MIDRTSKRNEVQTPTKSSIRKVGVVRPVHIATVNWIGLSTLYKREVQRFMKIAMQSLAAPVITSLLFLMVFSVAIGERASFAGDVDFVTFLVPGLVMMNVLQNAFANTSSSLSFPRFRAILWTCWCRLWGRVNYYLGWLLLA